MPELEEGDYYWKDLMGCQVVTTEGYSLGKVIDMMETGSNDVLVIKANLKDAFGIKGGWFRSSMGRLSRKSISLRVLSK